MEITDTQTTTGADVHDSLASALRIADENESAVHVMRARLSRGRASVAEVF
jgi:hypothetical protein